MNKYLVFYLKTGGGAASVSRKILPTTLYVQGRERQFWWYLQLNKDGVYSRPRYAGGEPRLDTARLYLWAGALPENWIDHGGSLRGRDGNLIFIKT